MFAVDDLRHAQVDLDEIVDRDLRRQLFDVAGDGVRQGRCGLRARGGGRGSGRRRGRLVEQVLDHLGVDALHQVAVDADRAAQQRRMHALALRVVPRVRVVAQEFAHARRHVRQHRRQHDRQLAEQDQRGRADVVQLGRLGVVLGQDPRLVLVDVAVGDVGHFHDFAQRLAEFARFEICRDAGLARAVLAVQGAGDPFFRVIGQGRRQLAVEFLRDEAGAAAGDVHVLADQVAVHARDEVLAREVQVLDPGVQLEREVVAQPFRVHAQLQVAQRRDARAARLRHLFVVHGQVAVDVHLQPVDDRVAREIQHRRPEQQVERDDVLADEVHLFGGRIVQERFVVDAFLLEVVLQAGQVADRRVQPDIEELARRVRNRDAEVRRVARDVPVGQLFAVLAQPFRHLVDHLRLQAARRVQPILEELEAARVGQLEEVLFGRLQDRRRAREHGVRVDEFGRLVGGTAHFAVVAVLVLCMADRALALDVAVGQEHALGRVVEAIDRLRVDQAVVAQAAVDALRQIDVFRRIRGIPVVERDVEAVQVLGAAGRDPGHEFLRRDAFLLGGDHDRRAVGVVRADEVHGALLSGVALHSLEADPDVGLDVLHHVADVEGSVGVGQGGGDEQLACHGRMVEVI